MRHVPRNARTTSFSQDSPGVTFQVFLRLHCIHRATGGLGGTSAPLLLLTLSPSSPPPLADRSSSSPSRVVDVEASSRTSRIVTTKSSKPLDSRALVVRKVILVGVSFRCSSIPFARGGEEKKGKGARRRAR